MAQGSSEIISTNARFPQSITAPSFQWKDPESPLGEPRSGGCDVRTLSHCNWACHSGQGSWERRECLELIRQAARRDRP